MSKQNTIQPFDPATTTRPVPALMIYYVIVSLCTVILFPVVIWQLLFKYNSLKYKFDDQGVSMSWGVLFKREVYLTYRRIQDIHVSRGIIQRQLGLATVSVQTASGSIGAQMSIEGIGDPEGLRDYLYSRMRGSKNDPTHGTTLPDTDDPRTPVSTDEALVLLKDILEEVRGLREDRRGKETGHG